MMYELDSSGTVDDEDGDDECESDGSAPDSSSTNTPSSSHAGQQTLDEVLPEHAARATRLSAIARAQPQLQHAQVQVTLDQSLPRARASRPQEAEAATVAVVARVPPRERARERERASKRASEQAEERASERARGHDRVAQGRWSESGTLSRRAAAAGLAPDVKFSCGKAQLHFTV